MRSELVSYQNPAWCFYSKNDQHVSPFHEESKVGKFTTFGEGDIPENTQLLIRQAISEGATPLVKHTNPEAIGLNPHSKDGSWVIIWYSTDDDKALKALASFLTCNGFVRKTKKGRYYNISFKYDTQTRNGEYGEDFKPSIRLQDIMNLDTGEILT